jgi:16S rRNA G966 N2-methylase RsmD
LLLDSAIQKTQTLDLYSGNGISIEVLVRQAAEIFQIEPQIEFVGSVPEFIEFQSNDATMVDEFNFQPEISLRDGLLKVYAWTKEQNA